MRLITLEAAAITAEHLEQLTDRGDGVLVLVRPHDDVPKTILLERLIPQLTVLLAEHNATITEPALQMRLRAVVHAGEVHDDGWGFYGGAIDVAVRLLDAASVKRALKQAASPLVLVISEDIHSGIVSQGYVDSGMMDTPENAAKFLARYGNPYAATGADSNGRASIEWGVYGVPETFVVGRDAKIAYKLIGPITRENLDSVLRREVEKALAAGG